MKLNAKDLGKVVIAHYCNKRIKGMVVRVNKTLRLCKIIVLPIKRVAFYDEYRTILSKRYRAE